MAEVGQRLIVGKDDDRRTFGANALEFGADGIASLVDTAIEGEVGGGLLTLCDVTESVVANSVDDFLRNVWKHAVLLRE